MNQEVKSIESFSAREQALLLAIIDSSMQVSSEASFIDWSARELNKILPHGMMLSVIGTIQEKSFTLKRVLRRNFPQGFLDASELPNGALAMSPVVENWWRSGKPILFQPEVEKITGRSFWGALVKRFDLRNKAAHGLRVPDEQTVTYFSFYQIPETLTSRHAYILELLVPHMHAALMRSVRSLREAPPGPQLSIHSISPREAEILKWLQCGKTNWEIGRIMGLRENTIKTYVERILKKLDVVNRTQAVAKATQLKLLPP